MTAAGRRQAARALLLDLDGVLVDAGLVVAPVVDLIRSLRAHERPVGLAVNTTSTLDDDLRRLSLVDEFDEVVTSADVGTHRPTKEFFEAACRALRTPPPACLYVDDEDRNIRAARVAGLSAYRWNGVADLPYLRAALGL